MANEIPPIDVTPGPVPGTADPGQVQVLLASNIADDDQLWVVRCSINEMYNMLLSPVPWVSSLGKLPGWVDAGTGQQAPAPVLTDDFGLMVEPTEVDDVDGWVAIQGISGTNCLKVLATRASAVRAVLQMNAVAEETAQQLGVSLESARAMSDTELKQIDADPFAPFWKEVAQDPANPPTFKKKLLVEVLLPLSRFFAHFELINPVETAAERAVRAGAFLLASVFDPEGEAAMLNALDQEALYVKGPLGVKGDPITISSGQITTGFYANIDRTLGSGATALDDDPPTDCVAIDGPYTPPDPPATGDGRVGGQMVKRYGIESGGGGG